LELDDIDMTEEVIHIRPNRIRRLKTPSSMRTLPLVGYAKEAMELALHEADDQHLFPRYIKDAACRATHASNALGKWLKRDFNLTAHSPQPQTHIQGPSQSLWLPTRIDGSNRGLVISRNHRVKIWERV